MKHGIVALASAIALQGTPKVGAEIAGIHETSEEIGNTIGAAGETDLGTMQTSLNLEKLFNSTDESIESGEGNLPINDEKNEGGNEVQEKALGENIINALEIQNVIGDKLYLDIGKGFSQREKRTIDWFIDVLKGEFSPEETACYVLAIARESNPSIEEATEEKWEEIENYGDPENIGGIYAGLKAINKSEQELDESKELLAIAMELTTKMEQELKKVQEELRMVNQNLQAKEAEIQKNDEIYVNLLVEIHEKYGVDSKAFKDAIKEFESFYKEKLKRDLPETYVKWIQQLRKIT